MEIRETCKQIIAEAQAILDYTDSIAAVRDASLTAVFTETRADELAHLQKLVVALTELMSGDEPAQAELMD